jgi:AcrR family transcriptional regulator
VPKRDRAYMDARRDEILDAAAACLLRTGLTGLSTTAICAEAAISTGALYTHFKSKAEILRALAERSARERRSTLQSAGVDGLRSALHALVDEEKSETGKAVSRVDLQLLSLKGDDEDFSSVIAQLRDNDDFTETLQRLAQRGELGPGVDPVAAAVALEGFLMGVKVLSLMGEKHAAAYGAALDLLVNSIAAKAAAQAD